MNVIALWQHDSRWGGQRLGTKNGTTLAGYGCLCVCLTMANNAFDPNSHLFPNNVDDVLTTQGGYVAINAAGAVIARSPQMGCNLVDWSKVQPLFPNLGYFGAGYYDNVAADVAKIAAWIDGGGLVICQVNWGGKTGAMHFVLAYGHNGAGDILVADPETGKPQWFSSKLFGTGSAKVDILRAHFYKDAIPNAAVPTPAPTPPPASPTGGKGSGPVAAPAPATNQEVPMTDAQEQQAYQIVLGRAREGAPTGRTGIQFIIDAQGELKAQANARAQAQADLAQKLADAVDIATKQGTTIGNLTAELDKLVPEYVRTEVKATAPASYLTTQSVMVVDFADKHAPVQVEANMILDEYSRFTVAGREYVRSQTTADNGDWYGYPVEALQPYTAGPVASKLDLASSQTALNTSQQITALAADGLSGWQKFLGALNIFGGKK